MLCTAVRLSPQMCNNVRLKPSLEALTLWVQRPCQSNNLVGAFGALPCPELPELEALQAAQDARQASREASTQRPFTQLQTLSWTPRVPAGTHSGRPPPDYQDSNIEFLHVRRCGGS